MFRIFLVTLIFILSGSNILAQNNDAIDALISQYDLDELSAQQKAKLRTLIIELTRQLYLSSTLSRSAQAYVENEGYEELYVKLSRFEGQNYLVVKKTFGTYATDDLPWGFGTYGFQDGYYYCDPDPFGGINEMIDINGNTQSFLFADWIDVE